MSAICFCDKVVTPMTVTIPNRSSSLYSHRPSYQLRMVSGNGSSTDQGRDSRCGPLRCTNKASGGDRGGAEVAVKQGIASPDGVSSIITEELFEEMFPYRNDRRSPAKGFYTYEAFLTAASRFPAFGTTGTLEERKRELAAFFGQTSHETRGGWKDCDGGRYRWGYSHIRQVNPPSDYVVENDRWPAAPGQQYYGRGPIQLTFNWNYGQAGKALGLDLLNNPDLVASDAVVAFSSALWFWMTPQDSKPSCHDVILGKWTPSEADLEVNRVPGYGLLTNIINPGECNRGPDMRVASRIAFFERYCQMFGVTMGDNLDCYQQCRF